MSLLSSSGQSLKSAARVLVVLGPPGSGKTTLSVSASSFAGDTISGGHRLCKDLVLISGDAEGVAGAMDAGLEPRAVADLTVCETWAAYQKALASVIEELKPLVDKGEVKYVVIDLALPGKLILDHVKPQQISDWPKVAAEGMMLYKSLRYLRGATIIANSQIKSSVGAVENDVAKAAAEAKAVGGERATFTLDLPKGIFSPWVENASLMLAREVKKQRDPMKKDAPARRVYFTHTSANARFETKSRFNSKIAPTEPGERSLNSILRDAYGENL